MYSTSSESVFKKVRKKPEQGGRGELRTQPVIQKKFDLYAHPYHSCTVMWALISHGSGIHTDPADWAVPVP